MRTSLGWLWPVLLGLSLTYVVASNLLLAPVPGNIDSQAFKDSGANLALGRGMTSALNFGNPTTDPKIYAGYAPGLSLVYGAYAALAGVSPAANSWFEAVVATLAACFAFALLLPALVSGPQVQRLAIPALFLFALLDRYISLFVDRPDALGLALALAAQLPRLASRPGTAVAAVLAGLAIVVSPICGVLAVVGIALRWVLAPDGERVSLPVVIALGAVGTAAPWLVAVAILQLADPSYLERLGSFASFGLSPFTALLSGDFAAWWDAFYVRGYSTLHHWLGTAMLLLAMGGCTLLLVSARPEVKGSRRALALLVLWGTAVFAAVVIPWSKLYSALAAGLLLPALTQALPSPLWRRRAPRTILFATVSALLVVQLPFSLQRLVSQASLESSYVRMRQVLAAPLADRTGDGEVWISLDPFGYFLFKPLGYSLAISSAPGADAPAILARLDYLALSYIGSGDPLVPHRPPWWDEVVEDFELLYRPELPQLLTLWGIPFSNSSHTWEMEVWGRRLPD